MRYTSTLAVLLAALPCAVAQNNTTESTCPSRILSVDQNTPFNASGSISFTYHNAPSTPDLDPWYLSVLVNDTTPARNLSSRDSDSIQLSGFLSTGPDVQNATTCVYQFSPVNATSMGNGANDTGCAGVLSDACTAFLVEELEDAAQGATRPQSGRLCPQPFTSEEAREVCGEGTFGAIWTSMSFHTPSPVRTH